MAKAEELFEEEGGAAGAECAEGAPAWVMTFADLMSLLMCFFVLLLSFSEIEATKFKQMAGSMRMAFGVQKQIEATEIPMGTSIIAQSFSPNVTEPTPVEEVRQKTFDERETIEPPPERSNEVDAEALKAALEKEIRAGMIEVETRLDRIVIRIREKGSFPSGSDDLNPEFIPVLRRIRDSIAAMPGRIEVVGHTDDVPIHTYRFRSNWDLSAGRAASVLHELLWGNALERGRLELKGMAEVQPLEPNTSADNRAANRRVEIVLWTETSN